MDKNEEQPAQIASTASTAQLHDLDQFTAYCKSKGFVYPTAEIYGGLAGFFEYGPLGVQLKRNILSSYNRHFVQSRENVIEQEGSIVTNPKVWEASGHLANFDDPVAVTSKGYRIRADHLLEEFIENSESTEKADSVKNAGSISNEAENFSSLTPDQLFEIIKKRNIKYRGDTIVKVESANLMFQSDLITGQKVYLRPETCQNIFCNAKYLAEISRLQLPFGIVQQGKVYRNEINPRYKQCISVFLCFSVFSFKKY